MYKYRKHLRGSFLNYCVVLIIFLSFVLLSSFSAILAEGIKLFDIDFLFIGILLVIAFIFLLLELALIYFLFLRRFKYINVTLSEDAIIYNNRKKQIIIPYDEITSIKYPSIKYMGGWMDIKYNNGKIRLTVVLENIGDFMYQLKEILDKHGKSNVYNEKKSFNFFKTASFTDESWQRAYENIKFIIIMEYLSLLMTILLVSLGVIQDSFIIFLGGISAPIIGYMISEIIIGRIVRKRVVGKEFKIIPRDSSKEKKIMRISMTTSILICAFIIIII